MVDYEFSVKLDLWLSTLGTSLFATPFYKAWVAALNGLAEEFAIPHRVETWCPPWIVTVGLRSQPFASRHFAKMLNNEGVPADRIFAVAYLLHDGGRDAKTT